MSSIGDKLGVTVEEAVTLFQNFKSLLNSNQKKEMENVKKYFQDWLHNNLDAEDLRLTMNHLDDQEVEPLHDEFDSEEMLKFAQYAIERENESKRGEAKNE